MTSVKNLEDLLHLVRSAALGTTNAYCRTEHYGTWEYLNKVALHLKEAEHYLDLAICQVKLRKDQ